MTCRSGLGELGNRGSQAGGEVDLCSLGGSTGTWGWGGWEGMAEAGVLERAQRPCSSSPGLCLRWQLPADVGPEEVKMLDAGRELLCCRGKLEGVSCLSAGEGSSRLRLASKTACRHSVPVAFLLPRSLV